MYACHKILNVARTNIRIFFKGEQCIMKKSIRVILSITTENGTYENSTTQLEQIDAEHIVFKTSRPVRLNSNAFKLASVRVKYGNRSNVVFFLNELEKVDGDELSFKAPKKKLVNLERFGMGVISTECCGYEKLCSMLKPKRTQKVAAYD